MERKIGEIFEYNGEWYQCIKGVGCEKCDLRNIICRRDTSTFPFKACSGNFRTDNKSVIFKKLEKVGEPIKFGKKLMQDYKVFVEPYIPKELEYFTIKSARDLTILIEIKQTK